MTLLEELCLSQEPVQSSVPTFTTTGADTSDNPGCWVARAVYGESNPQWRLFREWLLNDAPAWFRNLYIRHGESFAGWLAPHEGLKNIIRRWMDGRIKGRV
jgi:hypothetical protein